MDLSNFDVVAAAGNARTIEIFDPHDNPTDITISVLGTDSDTYRTKERELQSRKRGKKRLEELTDFQAQERNVITCMAHCTTAWTNVYEDGEPLECNTLNARRIYEKYPWLREQVIEAMRDRAEFLGEAEPTS